MPRLRLYDVRLGRLSEAVGITQGDIVGMAELINAAQLRLITAREIGDTGFWGGWARTAFEVSRESPYLTLPRTIARIINLDVCRHPIRIQNEFYEFMEFGIGKQPSFRNRCGRLEAFDRGVYPTFVDMPANSFVRVYLVDGSDSGGQRTLIQGFDSNGQRVISQDGYNQVEGIFLPLVAPFVDCPIAMTRITGIQKDVTAGPLRYFAVDRDTGVETPILVMDPGELVSGYRRYYLNGLPNSCCGNGTPGTLQVEGIAKLELLPVTVDTDYLLIQNIEALIAECKSIRYGNIDNPEAKALARDHHKEAIGLLQGEIKHYLGTDEPAIVYAPLGSARLERVKISMQ